MNKFENMGHSLNANADFGNMFESVKPEEPKAPVVVAEGAKPEIEEITEENFFESVQGDGELMMEAFTKSSETTLRAQAMSAAIEFAKEGFSKSEDLDEFAIGLADVDDDGDVSESEQEDYEVALNVLADAFVSLGVKADCVKKAIEGDDAETEKLVNAVQDKLDDEDDTGNLIANFAVKEQLMLESTRKKVVRNGKITWIKKPLKKRRMSAAQKAALKKARRKANTGAAKRARAKAMKLRKKSGL